jgi:hypothetical protein
MLAGVSVSTEAVVELAAIMRAVGADALADRLTRALDDNMKIRENAVRDHRGRVHGTGGVSVFFAGSWVFFTNGALVPASGDQDLLLRLFSTTGPVVASSSAGGTSLDFVWLTLPSPFGPLPFLPVFQVLGFATGVCATFSATGA